jgi:hypothetical protein
MSSQPSSSIASTVFGRRAEAGSARAGWDDEPPPTFDRREVILHDLERELITRERADELIRALDEADA